MDNTVTIQLTKYVINDVRVKWIYCWVQIYIPSLFC